MTEIKIPLDASLVHSLLSSETEGVQKLLKQVLEAILEARATDIAGDLEGLFQQSYRQGIEGSKIHNL
jgi:hypothetical protein